MPTPTRFRHSHDDRVTKKNDLRHPYRARGWDLTVVLGHTDARPKRITSPKLVCGCALCRNDDKSFWRGDRLPRATAKREAIAEELMHARELEDMHAITEDEWDLDYLDSRGRDWLEGCEELEVLDRLALLDDLEEAELTQAPTPLWEEVLVLDDPDEMLSDEVVWEHAWDVCDAIGV